MEFVGQRQIFSCWVVATLYMLWGNVMSLIRGRLLLLLFLFAPMASMGADAENTYKVDLGSQVFSLSVPRPPVKPFVRHQAKIAMEDAEQHDKYGGIKGLGLSWIFSNGVLFRKDEGAFEIQMFVRAATYHNVESIDGLKIQVLERFRRSRFTASDVFFDEAEINGRKWLIYKVPAKSLHAYATGVRADRYVVVQLSFIDNTAERSPAWMDKAYQLATDILGSMRIE